MLVFSDYNIKYTTVLGDTINYSEKSNNLIYSLFHKYMYPIFGSRRVYLVTLPELSYEHGISDRFRSDGLTETFSQKRSNTISAGFHVGILVFPFSGFSLEAKVGPLGIGYGWENFYENDITSTSAQNFFINLSPKLYMFNFIFSSYF